VSGGTAGAGAGGNRGTSELSRFVRHCAGTGRLAVQPRMGFATVQQMRRGLEAVRDCPARTVGTVTLDSYTRLNRHEVARKALADRQRLNGYPLVAHGDAANRELLAGVAGPDFPVQARHGSPLPAAIFAAMTRCGIGASEGGPVSYCLPYGRTPLADSVREWANSCEFLAAAGGGDARPHLETFGGCMLGQLCPPGLLVALSVLEGLFFAAHGVDSISLSYAQQTDPEQDVEAVRCLRLLTAEYLPEADTHTVVYTYMGLYPETAAGADAALRESVALAQRTGAERLIVKTRSEAGAIPTVEANVTALRLAAAAYDRLGASPGPAAAAADAPDGPDGGDVRGSETYAEAKGLVDAVLDLDGDLDRALVLAFARGYLDVPYCLHPDNRSESRSFIDSRGRLRWATPGRMPIRPAGGRRGTAGAGDAAVAPPSLDSSDLMRMLTYNRRRFDAIGAAHPGGADPDASHSGGLGPAGTAEATATGDGRA
jgi:methylaspartate mutase epsilon subunit